ncbi:MAG: TatD family hydrolase [Candidatus Rokubacteria bacterium]|nr:TatD family hydrolase [Candidatus Rokubacteria bacterium]
MMIDTHCHLHDPAYADLGETLRVSLTHDVWGVIAVGVDAATNERTLAAATAFPKAVWPCLGFHPDKPELDETEFERVIAQLHEHHARLVALGEVGLPWYSLDGRPDAAALMTRGKLRLDHLLDVAVRYDLPVALHAPHGAAVGAFEALKRHGLERAVFHWHKAPPEVTRAIVDAGYLVSVGPEVVYRERDRELVAAVDLESLLVETDGPWPYRGEFEGMASGPWLASRVAEEVAKIKRLPVDDVMFQLSANACRLFDLMWA